MSDKEEEKEEEVKEEPVEESESVRGVGQTDEDGIAGITGV